MLLACGKKAECVLTDLCGDYGQKISSVGP
jgi:hypothetical protein